MSQPVEHFATHRNSISTAFGLHADGMLLVTEAEAEADAPEDEVEADDEAEAEADDEADDAADAPCVNDCAAANSQTLKERREDK